MLLKNKKRNLFLFKKNVATYIHNMTMLEGIEYSFYEIQMLNEGITLNRHTIEDLNVAMNQVNATDFLIRCIEDHQFDLVEADKLKRIACAIHDLAGEDDALEWGQFRDGAVSIAGTGYNPPDASDLNHLWKRMIDTYYNTPDKSIAAIEVFLTMARTQFFYHCNKRLGRYMMNGLLLSNGYPAIDLPYTKQHEFDQLMLDFYDNNESTQMVDFMMDIALNISPD